MKKPYFYIIEDVVTSKLYAGSKFGADAAPSTFWVEGGYTTSSNEVNSLVEEFGLERFSVKKLKPMEDAYDYETRFLIKVDAKNNPRFYNGHNNDGNAPSTGTEGFKQMMLKKHGVEHPAHLQEVRDKIGKTLKGYVKSEEAKKKQSETRKQRIEEGLIVFKTGPRDLTPEQRKRMSEANRRFGKDNSFYGKTHSEETKKKLSEASKKKIKCPHCPVVGQQSVMKRWHFDRCKELNS